MLQLPRLSRRIVGNMVQRTEARMTCFLIFLGILVGAAYCWVAVKVSRLRILDRDYGRTFWNR